jgi:hypothetical protein
MIGRREFITLLGGVAAAWPPATRAQPSRKTYRIGFLGMTSYADRRRDVDALRTGLRQFGYEEGKMSSTIGGPRANTTASLGSQPTW